MGHHKTKLIKTGRSSSSESELQADFAFISSRTIEKLGLWSDETEPCIYGGYVKGLGHALLVAYVDDVLLASENEKVQKAVEEADIDMADI